jgi:hypothetical protein
MFDTNDKRDFFREEPISGKFAVDGNVGNNKRAKCLSGRLLTCYFVPLIGFRLYILLTNASSMIISVLRHCIQTRYSFANSRQEVGR